MSSVEQLDIVQANRDLVFPPNVRLRFLYWQHTIENLPGLEPHLSGADAVAWETSSIVPMPGKTALESGKLVEWAINETIQGNVTEDTEALVEHYSFSASLCEFLTTLPNKPKLHLVDDYAGSTEARGRFLIKYFSNTNYGETESLPEDFAYMDLVAKRESVTLRQLAEISTALGTDNDISELCVVFGSNHSLLDVAAKALGASTERITVARTSRERVVRAVIRLMRFGVLPRFEDMTTEDQEIIKAAVEIDDAICLKRTDTRPLMSAATVLEAVSELPADQRETLKEHALEVNRFRIAKFDRRLREGGPIAWLLAQRVSQRCVEDQQRILAEFLDAVKSGKRTT